MRPETLPRVVLGVTGSISAYRAADLVSLLTKEGIEVDVILTREGARFITALTLQTLSHRPVYMEDGVAPEDSSMPGRPTHIALGDDADLVLVAPATANVIGNYAHGLAPDLLSATLLATPAPIVFAPAMNGKMWNHPAVQDNVRLLTKRGVRWIGPDAGILACGYEGMGRLWPVPKIFEEVREMLKISPSKLRVKTDASGGVAPLGSPLK